MDIKGTQTEKNLQTAFAGESQARNKYTYYASQAKKEGYEQIAAIFLETADNEKEHAKMWYKLLNGGVGTTTENLKAASYGENYEWKVQVDYHSMANNQTYDWHGETYGPFETPEFKDRDTDTTLYFYDAAAMVTSKGCDSIWRLELTISDTYLFRSTKTICDIDSIHWRDSVILGAKWKEGTPNPTDIRLTTDTTFVILEKWQTVTAPTRDSIYMLTVTQYPTFYEYDTLHVCDNDSVK